MELFTVWLCIVSLCAFVWFVLFAPIFVQSTEPTGSFKTLNKYYYFDKGFQQLISFDGRKWSLQYYNELQQHKIFRFYDKISFCLDIYLYCR